MTGIEWKIFAYFIIIFIIIIIKFIVNVSSVNNMNELLTPNFTMPILMKKSVRKETR
jgi:hypothetical protein